MGFNITRSAQFLEKEVLKYAHGREMKKSVVLDAEAFPMPSDRNKRNVVPAGTLLVVSPTNSKQVCEYSGTGAVFGILAHSVEIIANSTAGDTPAPMYYFNAVFATSALVKYTNYASAVHSSLPTCRFE